MVRSTSPGASLPACFSRQPIKTGINLSTLSHADLLRCIVVVTVMTPGPSADGRRRELALLRPISANSASANGGLGRLGEGQAVLCLLAPRPCADVGQQPGGRAKRSTGGGGSLCPRRRLSL